MRQVSIYGLLYMTVLMITLAISNLVVGQESGDAGVTLKVAAVCMNAKSDTAANLGTFTAYIREASEKGVHLIVFPEIALQQNPGWGASSYVPTGVELAYVQDTAETIPGTSTDALVQIARENHISVVFGMTEISPTGDLYNASVFLGPGGIFGNELKSLIQTIRHHLIGNPPEFARMRRQDQTGVIHRQDFAVLFKSIDPVGVNNRHLVEFGDQPPD